MIMAESSPKRVENTVGRGEIAHFQKTCTADTLNQGLFGKGLMLYHTIPHFNDTYTVLVVRSGGRGLGNLFTAVVNHVAPSRSPAT